MASLHQFKWFVLNHAWWAGVTAGMCVLIAWWPLGFLGDWKTALPLAGGLLSGAFLIQKQNLDELKLFHELFRDFNRRYDGLNGRLLSIINVDVVDSDEDLQALIDYFNLCAEEYWWYRAGHIPAEVWRSWCRGMLQYVEHEPIRKHWKSEVTQGSYYGLTLEVIRQGANARATGNEPADSR